MAFASRDSFFSRSADEGLSSQWNQLSIVVPEKSPAAYLNKDELLTPPFSGTPDIISHCCRVLQPTTQAPTLADIFKKDWVSFPHAVKPVVKVWTVDPAWKIAGEGAGATLRIFVEDPVFAAYLESMNTPKLPQPKISSTLPLPLHQLPSIYNNYSISNYAVELILTEGLKHGSSKAEETIDQLLQCVPFSEKDRCRRMILQRAQSLTKKRSGLPLCPFCRNNGLPSQIYSTHTLKDSHGRVLCPVLRAYVCPRCGASGDNAHTISYCPGSS